MIKIINNKSFKLMIEDKIWIIIKEKRIFFL